MPFPIVKSAIMKIKSPLSDRSKTFESMQYGIKFGYFSMSKTKSIKFKTGKTLSTEEKI